MSKWPDLAGRIEGETHILPIRVYYEDTDFAGHVYHANYLKFCERGRSDFIRLLGIDHQSLAAAKMGEPGVFVVRHIEIEYLKPAQVDEVLEVVTRCAHIGGASLVLQLGQECLADPHVRLLTRACAGPRRCGCAARPATRCTRPSGW